jgi:hypothetical protein
MTPATTRHRITRRATAVVLAAAIATAGVVAAIAAGGGDSSSGTSVSLRAAGNASIGNSKGNTGQAIFSTPATLKPGGTASATVTITNTGDPSTFQLSKANLKDVKGAISDDLGLKVVDNATPGTPIYDGQLNAMPSKALGTWANGESHTYTFTVSLPHSVGNTEQGSQVTVDFNWNATALDIPDTGGGGGGGGGTDTGGGGGVTTQPVTTNPGGGFNPSGGGAGGLANVGLGGATTQNNPGLVTFFATCSQACTLNVGGTVSVPGAAKTYRLTSRNVQLRAGVKTKVTVRFPAKVRNAVRKAINRRRTVTVGLKLTPKNAAGASRASTRRIRIRHR